MNKKIEVVNLSSICLNPLAYIVYYNLGQKLEEERTKTVCYWCVIYDDVSIKQINDNIVDES
jgi:hypothetical protein